MFSSHADIFLSLSHSLETLDFKFFKFDFRLGGDGRMAGDSRAVLAARGASGRLPISRVQSRQGQRQRRILGARQVDHVGEKAVRLDGRQRATLLGAEAERPPFQVTARLPYTRI
jgi:hypothetical protein